MSDVEQMSEWFKMQRQFFAVMRPGAEIEMSTPFGRFTLRIDGHEDVMGQRVYQGTMVAGQLMGVDHGEGEKAVRRQEGSTNEGHQEGQGAHRVVRNEAQEESQIADQVYKALLGYRALTRVASPAMIAEAARIATHVVLHPGYAPEVVGGWAPGTRDALAVTCTCLEDKSVSNFCGVHGDPTNPGGDCK